MTDKDTFMTKSDDIALVCNAIQIFMNKLVPVANKKGMVRKFKKGKRYTRLNKKRRDEFKKYRFNKFTKAISSGIKESTLMAVSIVAQKHQEFEGKRIHEELSSIPVE